MHGYPNSHPPPAETSALREADETIDILGGNGGPRRIDLPQADQEVLAGVNASLSKLQDLQPPLAEDAFKANFQKSAVDGGKIYTDIKGKIRSLSKLFRFYISELAV